MRFVWLGAGVVVLLVASACSSSRAPDGPTESEPTRAAAQAIQGGTNDTAHKFAVGVCAGGQGNCYGICSGALIAPNVVATARHCVDDSPEMIDCKVNPSFGARKVSSVDVTTNADMFGSSRTGWHAVKAVAVPQDSHICGNDIALLVLDDLVSATEATPATPGVQLPMYNKKYKRRFAAVGYGITGPKAGGSGTRRILEDVPVLCVPNSPTKPCPPELHVREFVGGDGTCSGDSGSSAFEQATFTAGDPVSFGVLSRGGMSEDGKWCEGSIYTRLDAFRDLVISTVTTASNNWSLYPEPAWTAYVPPESDAGAPDAGPTTKPAGKGLGEACGANEECSSKACADTGDGTKICSRACNADDATSCPEGYACKESMCLPKTEEAAAPAATKTITTSGCSAAGDPEPSPWGFCAVLAAGALAATRRRRSWAARQASS
jgi:MYXO-CTERM domain-containing protein